MKKNIAIIGAGISGLTLAGALREQANVTVFEKARGVGGRMSTRYAEPYYFDHGTQFFTARQPAFQQFLAPLIDRGIVAPWEGKVITMAEGHKPTDRIWFEPHYVAVPNMNSLCKHMAEGIAVQCGVEVAPLGARHADGWHLSDKDGAVLGVFDWVISTAPPVQTTRLFAAHLKADEPLQDTKLLGCYTLMFGFDRPWEKSWIGAKIQNSPLEWIAINSSKPGRNASVTSIVVHSSNVWAEEHIDDVVDEAAAFLRAEFERITQMDTKDATYFSCHRWRYAIVDSPKPLPPYMDATLGLASAGDWCHASRIEDAWLSARLLAGHVASTIRQSAGNKERITP